VSLLASIPSPSDGVLHLGPLPIHAYGLMIALGVVAAVSLCGRRMEAAGVGTRDDMSSIAMWAVGAGVIGARIYFIITDKTDPWKTPSRWLKIWEGGLGIPGGLLAGVLVGMWAIKRRGLSVPGVFDAAAPAIPIAQAVGRLGNWWNQELFGRPTKLPWALEIDAAHRPDGYEQFATYHPTFLYEATWNLALAGVLILIGRRFRLRPGRLLAVYVVGYSIGRFWVEGLRIDPANAGGGWRLNQWTAVVSGAVAALFLLVDWFRHRGDVPTDAAADDTDGETAADMDGDVEDDSADSVDDSADIDGAEDDSADDDAPDSGAPDGDAAAEDEPASVIADGDDYLPEDE